jgi:hypothetical protein
MRVLILLSVAMPAIIAQPCFGESSRSRTVDFARSDSRLAATITVREYDISIGDLLERASAQSGVILRCDRQDGSANVRVSVYAHAYRISDLMPALYSLLSHKDAQVYWARSGKTGAYVYELRFPLNARRLAARLREEAQSAFERAAETMLRLAAMDPQERGKHSADISRAFMQKDDDFAKLTLPEERTWNGLKLVSEALSPEQQRAVITGSTRITVQTGELSAAGQSFLESEYQRDGSQTLVRDRDGTTKPMPPPSSVTFLAPRDPDDVTRSLIVYPNGLWGYSYAGGSPLENAYIRKVHDLWIGPDDLLEPPKSVMLKQDDQPDDALQNEAPHGMIPTTTGPATQLERRLSQFADRAGVCVLARISSGMNQDPGSVGKSIPDFLKRLSELQKGLNLKWSGRTLLVEEPQWFWTEENTPAWASIKWFREVMKERKDFPIFKDICELSLRFTPQQLLKCGRECSSLPALADLWPVLQMCEAKTAFRDAVTSDKGLPLTSEVVDVLHKSSVLSSCLRSPDIRALCMEVKPWQVPGTDSTAANSVLFDVGFVTKDGVKQWAFGIKIKPPRRP